MAKCSSCFHYKKNSSTCGVANGTVNPNMPRVCGNYIEINGVVNMKDDSKIRVFSSGSTRDTNIGKLSYVKALSPIVLQRYVSYLDKHRVQSDGNLRAFDNWKQGIDEGTYLDSLGRHFVVAWLLYDGFPASDNHGPVTLEDALCGIIFNASGWLHEILKDKEKK